MDMSRRTSFFVLPAAALLAAGALLSHTGCANNPARVETSVHYLEERDIHRSFTEEGLLLEQFDINRDGVIDNFSYSQPLSRHGEELSVEELAEFTPTSLPDYRLVRRELDINFDGKIDFIRHYDVRGGIDKDEVDTNYNGIVDRVVRYSNGIITRREIDADEDGYFEERRHFVKGQIFRIEKDTTGNGQPDYWQFYEEGVLTRAGFDTDGDRVIDQWLVAAELQRAQRETQRDEAAQPDVPEDD